MDTNVTPPLPDGFTLDQGDIPPLPQGFTLDGQPPRQQPVSYSEEATRTYESSKKLGKKGLIDSLKGLGAFLYNNPVSQDIMFPQGEPTYEVPPPKQWEQNPLLGTLQSWSKANIPTPQETPTTFGGKAITKGAEWGAQLAPFLVAPQAAGIPLLAAMSAGSGYSQALEQGKTPEQATVDFGLGAASGGLMGKGFHMAQKLGPLAQGLSLPIYGRTMGTLESGYQAYEQGKPIGQAVKDYWTSPENVGQGLMETALGLGGAYGRSKVSGYGKPIEKAVPVAEEPPAPAFDPLSLAPQFQGGPQRQIPRGDVIPQPAPTFDVSQRVPTPARGRRLWESLKSESGYVDVSPEDITRLGEQLQTLLVKAKTAPPGMRKEIEASVDAFMQDTFPYSHGDNNTKLAVLQIAKQHGIKINNKGGQMRVEGPTELGVGLEEALTQNNPNLFRREVGILKFPEHAQKLRQEGKAPAQTFFEKLKRPFKEERGSIMLGDLRGTEPGKKLDEWGKSHKIIREWNPEKPGAVLPTRSPYDYETWGKVDPKEFPEDFGKYRGGETKAEKLGAGMEAVHAKAGTSVASPHYLWDQASKNKPADKSNLTIEAQESLYNVSRNMARTAVWRDKLLERSGLKGEEIESARKALKEAILPVLNDYNEGKINYSEWRNRTEAAASQLAPKHPSIAGALSIEKPGMLVNEKVRRVAREVGDFYNKEAKPELQRQGIPVIDEIYTPHNIPEDVLRDFEKRYGKPFDPPTERPGETGKQEWAGVGQNKIAQEAGIRSRQSYMHRVEGSFNPFPEMFTNLESYAPKLYKRLAIQNIMNRWGDVFENLSEKTHPKMYAESVRTLKDAFNRKHDWADKVTQGITHASAIQKLGASVSTGVKHTAKFVYLSAYHGAPVLAGTAQAVKTAIRKIGIKAKMSDEDWATRVADLFVSGRQTRQYLELAEQFGKEKLVIGKGKKALKLVDNIAREPVNTVEKLENFANIFTTLARAEGRDIDPKVMVRAVHNAIYGVSQRGGLDASRVHRGKARLATLFTQTPAKLGEFNYNLAAKALKGEKDILGDSYRNKLARGAIIAGFIYAADKILDTNYLGMAVLHFPWLFDKNREGKWAPRASVPLQFAGSLGKEGFWETTEMNLEPEAFTTYKKSTGPVPQLYKGDRARWMAGLYSPTAEKALQSKAAFRGETKRNRLDAMHEAEKMLQADEPDYAQITRILKDGGIVNTQEVISHLHNAKRFKAYPHIYNWMAMPPSDRRKFKAYLEEQGKWTDYEANIDKEEKAMIKAGGPK